MKKLYTARMSLSSDENTTDMAVDASTPKVFQIAPAAGVVVDLHRIIFYIEDAGTFDATKWGNGLTLTTGMKLEQKRFGITSDMLGYNLKTSGDLAATCYDVSQNGWGTGNEFLAARYTFTKGGAVVRLNGSYGDKLTLTLNDNMAALVSQYVLAQGVFVKGG